MLFRSVSATSFRPSDYRAMVEETRADTHALERVVHLDDEESWAALLADGDGVTADDLAARAASLSPTDPINIQYTSGTTGFPKGATLSHRNILNNGYLVGEVCGYTEADRVCIPVPFYHCLDARRIHPPCTRIRHVGSDRFRHSKTPRPLRLVWGSCAC